MVSPDMAGGREFSKVGARKRKIFLHMWIGECGGRREIWSWRFEESARAHGGREEKIGTVG